MAKPAISVWMLCLLLGSIVPVRAQESLVPESAWISDAGASLALARLLSYRKGTRAESARWFERYLKLSPEDSAARFEYARVLVSLEERSKATKEIAVVRRKEPDHREAALLQADIDIHQGDLAAGRALYERYVGEKHPDLKLRLRYGQQMRAWGDFDRAERIYRAYLDANPKDVTISLELAGLTAAAQRYEEAKAMLRGILSRHPKESRAGLELARIGLAEKDFAGAAGFANALPATKEVKRIRREAEEGLRKQQLALEMNGGVEIEAHDWSPEIQELERMLDRDPRQTNVRMTYAETLGASQRYEEALAQLAQLEKTFPDSFKVLLTRARVLSWAKRYRESLAVYQHLRELNPGNPVPAREMARVASWGKDRKLSSTLYNQLIADFALAGSGKDGMTRVSESDLRREDAYAPTDPRYAAWRIGRTAYLENEGKWLAWERRFLRSEDTFQALMRMEPGNQEVLFDLAQTQAAQGLGKRQVQTYGQLLALDPYHTRAQRALEMQQIRQHTGLMGNYWYRAEEGRVGLSDIKRHQLQLAVNVPMENQYFLRVGADYWLEAPGETSRTHEAFGHTLEGGGVINEYFSAGFRWTHKAYTESSLPDTDTGSATVAFNLFDYTKLRFQYERVDELHNQFGVRQGVQSDNWSVGFASEVTRRLQVEGRATYQRYNDGNRGVDVTVMPSYILSDHPHTLKVGITGQYRDTAEEAVSVYNGTRLADIKHPYWTPSNYYRGALTIQWRHDLSREFFAEAEHHYYDIKVDFATDSDENPGIGIEAEWFYEFRKHWAVQLRGTLFRSRDWDGEMGWASITYRF